MSIPNQIGNHLSTSIPISQAITVMSCTILTLFLLLFNLITSQGRSEVGYNDKQFITLTGISSNFNPQSTQHQPITTICINNAKCQQTKKNNHPKLTYNTNLMRMFDMPNFYKSLLHQKSRWKPQKDFKRNIFFSRGWGASGSPEMTGQIKFKKIKNGNDKIKYAFTSTHWGPLGKRYD